MKKLPPVAAPVGHRRPRVLPAAFFGQPALRVARGLLGMWLVRRRAGRETAYLITEVEAYDGPHDRASHASRGLTARNAPMFGPPGRWYVYLCYGMHWMLNVVTGPSGYPAAVLIRGVAGASGPGRVAKLLKVTRTQNGRLARPATGLWIEDRGTLPRHGAVARAPRIGVDYAGAWAGKPYRFFLRGRVVVALAAPSRAGGRPPRRRVAVCS